MRARSRYFQRSSPRPTPAFFSTDVLEHKPSSSSWVWRWFWAVILEIFPGFAFPLTRFAGLGRRGVILWSDRTRPPTLDALSPMAAPAGLSITRYPSRKYRRGSRVTRVRLRRAGKPLFFDATVSGRPPLRISSRSTPSPTELKSVSRKSFPPADVIVHRRDTRAPRDDHLFEIRPRCRSPPRPWLCTDGHLTRSPLRSRTVHPSSSNSIHPRSRRKPHPFSKPTAR